MATSELAQKNDAFRKTREGFALLMVPNVELDRLSALEFAHEAMAAVHAFDFPAEDKGERNTGTVKVGGHIFRWEICYIPPGKTVHDDGDFVLEPVSDQRQLRVYVPTNDT